MNTIKLWAGLGVISALALSGGSALGQQTGAGAQTGDQQRLQGQADAQDQRLQQQPQGQPADRQVTEQQLQRQVTDINRASQFIGMRVRNLQEENLGSIEEIVFDPHAGRIAYVVLGVGGFLGIGDRYIAVPLEALAPAPGQNHLVMNADRQRIENAPGFGRDNWPPIDARMWGARAGFAETPDQLRDRDQNWLTTGQQRTTAEPQHGQLRSFTGPVSSINQGDRTITVTGPQGNDYLFRLEDEAQIRTAAQAQGTLNDLQIGSQVTVQYEVDGDRLNAHSIMARDAGTAVGQPGGTQPGQGQQQQPGQPGTQPQP